MTQAVAVEEINAQKERIDALRREVMRVYIGTTRTVDLMVTALLAQGHVLLEGVPGVAKTTLVKAYAAALGATVRRIQFTPDLLPADITGTYVLSPKEGTFTLRPGPIFANIVLADEINRATPKTQSALLESMSEGSVTVAKQTYKLEKPFFVLATQNPLEMEGTYPLPEAQLDRFFFKLHVPFPGRDELHQMLDLATGGAIDKRRSGRRVRSSSCSAARSSGRWSWPTRSTARRRRRRARCSRRWPSTP